MKQTIRKSEEEVTDGTSDGRMKHSDDFGGGNGESSISMPCLYQANSFGQA